MTEEVDFSFRRAAPGILGGLCLSLLSFQRKLESRRAGQDVKWITLFGLEG